MLFEAAFSPFYQILMFVLALLPDSMVFPQQLLNAFNHVVDIIFSNLGFLGMFVRISTIQALVPLIIFVTNFGLIYRLIMWCLSKIPGLNIN